MRRPLLLVALVALVPYAVADVPGEATSCVVPLAGPEAALAQTCFGIRPGAPLSTPVGGCSWNFVFVGDGVAYAGTAGHCGQEGMRVRIPDPASPGRRIDVGTIVLSRITVAPGVVDDVDRAVFGDPIDVMNSAVGTDFALVRIDPEDVHLVDPQMCYWGGPTGAYEGDTLDQVARHYGQGTGVGLSAATRPRSAVVTHLDEQAFGVRGVVAPGDSGSGIRLATGEALGIVTHGGPPSPQGSADAPQGFLSDGYGTRIGHALAMARAAGFQVELATAPLLHEDGTPLGAWPDPGDW